jgi:hypothetical protein
MMTDKDNELKQEIQSKDEMEAPPSPDSKPADTEVKAKPPEFLLPHNGLE